MFCSVLFCSVLFLLCCVVSCCVVLCCVVLCCVVLCCVVLCCVVLCCVVFCFFCFWCVVLCCAVLCSVLFCFRLFCSVLFCFVWFCFGLVFFCFVLVWFFSVFFCFCFVVLYFFALFCFVLFVIFSVSFCFALVCFSPVRALSSLCPARVVHPRVYCRTRSMSRQLPSVSPSRNVRCIPRFDADGRRYLQLPSMHLPIVGAGTNSPTTQNGRCCGLWIPNSAHVPWQHAAPRRKRTSEGVHKDRHTSCRRPPGNRRQSAASPGAANTEGQRLVRLTAPIVLDCRGALVRNKRSALVTIFHFSTEPPMPSFDLATPPCPRRPDSPPPLARPAALTPPRLRHRCLPRR